MTFDHNHVTEYVGLMAVLSIVFSSRFLAQTEAQFWSTKKLVEHHQAIKDSLGPSDVYKMLFQANFGVEHMLGDRSAVRQYLQSEWERLDLTEISGDSLIERISRDDIFVRVNLRPYKRLNLSPDTLVELMFRTVRETQADTTTFIRQWSMFVDLVRYGMVDFSINDVEALDARVMSGDFSPLRHSTSYRNANQPAYRVIRKDILLKYVSTAGIKY